MTEKVKNIINLLALEPLSIEGGFFKRTYYAEEKIPVDYLPVQYKSDRAYSSCIYYLITAGSFSTLHKLPGVEIFHFYLGDAVEMLQLHEDGSGTISTIGNNLENGERPQLIVPKNTWQGSRLKEGGEFALLGATMAPGFEYEDFIKADKADLLKRYPDFKNIIQELC